MKGPSLEKGDVYDKSWEGVLGVLLKVTLADQSTACSCLGLQEPTYKTGHVCMVAECWIHHKGG